MANDDENLYLIIQASDPDVLTKITNRGVVFSINTAGTKNDENAVSITYPVFDVRYGNKPYITFTNAGMYNYQRVAMEQNPDSVSKVANKRVHDNEKFIRTSGMPNVDTLLSIYNRKGISAAEAFDSTMAYTYELALPLKYLGLSKSSKFTYHIMLPGIDVDKDFPSKLIRTADGNFIDSTPLWCRAAIPTRDHMPIVISTTDFWGEYTLAKKIKHTLWI